LASFAGADAGINRSAGVHRCGLRFVAAVAVCFAGYGNAGSSTLWVQPKNVSPEGAASL
jgi:hypothetical protein